MPFCPSCEAEYQPQVRICPACDTAVVDHLDPRGSSEDLVDVFMCYDAQVAERVRELLQEAGTNPMLRDRSSQAFPTTVGTTGERAVAVPASQRETARRALEAALADSVLDKGDGELR